MTNRIEKYRRLIYMGIVVIALGIIFSTTMDSVHTLGFAMIAAGGLTVIMGMAEKRKISEKNDEAEPHQE